MRYITVDVQPDSIWVQQTALGMRSTYEKHAKKRKLFCGKKCYLSENRFVCTDAKHQRIDEHSYFVMHYFMSVALHYFGDIDIKATLLSECLDRILYSDSYFLSSRRQREHKERN